MSMSEVFKELPVKERQAHSHAECASEIHPVEQPQSSLEMLLGHALLLLKTR